MKLRTYIVITVLLVFSFLHSQEKAGGGPDGYGYRWIDSDEAGGPVYNWYDISSFGTILTPTLEDEDTSGDIYLGFYFNFYGMSYNYVKIMSNGYLSFSSSFCEFEYDPIPNSADPNGIVAPFWSDLDPSIQGNIYYYRDYTYGRFIVQFDNIVQWGESSGNTFQVIFYTTGEIYFQYNTMGGSMLDASTVGIEDAAGTTGLQVSNNSTYVKDNLAVRIYPSAVVYDGTLSVSESSLSYGNVTVNEKLAQSFTISNLHATEVLDGEITTIPGYTVYEAAKGIKGMKNVLEYSVDPSSSVDFYLVFQPGTADNFTGFVVVTSTDTENPSDSIHVSGLGVAPDITVSRADTLFTHLTPGGSTEDFFTIYNEGLGNLDYVLNIERISKIGDKGSGGPDSYGYIWKDSDETDGPDYNWVEISDVGTQVDLADEGFSALLPMGFTYNFYGTNYSSIKICSNGFLTFTSSTGSPTNGNIPDITNPNCIMAAFWDDLDPGLLGTIYYYADSAFNRFIVQYQNVARYGQALGNTFEIIIYADGSIVYQYKEMNGTLTSSTVGIENQDGTVGLQLAYNSAYLKNGLAVEFNRSYWLEAAPKSKYVLSNDSINVSVGFNTTNLTDGFYYADINIVSTDPDTPSVTIPVKMSVYELTAPINFSTSVTGSVLTLDWDDVPFSTGYKVYSSNDPYGTFTEDLGGTFIGSSWSISISSAKKFYYVTAYDAK